ncbi:MAG TPA: hypothetical protein VNJ08_09665 [Bacteriovoracaceae bacterium]|nr:hypothetical protein [Bacteriovoracaceae bacterium]
MKKSFLTVMVLIVSTTAFASELKDCEKKIAEMLNQVKTTRLDCMKKMMLEF